MWNGVCGGDNERTVTDSAVSLHAVVSGMVQGVSFRYYTRQTARRLGLRG